MRRTCADDLAVALRSTRLAGDLVPVFREAEAVAGLHTESCKALVLAHGEAGERAGRLREQLQESAPGWQNFEVVVPKGTYLGVSLS